jgi:hypothetical protein
LDKNANFFADNWQNRRKNIDGWSPWLTTTFLHLALTNENGAFNKALGI